MKEISGNRPSKGRLLQSANVKKIHDVLKSALTQAIAWEYLPIYTTNPAKMAILPKAEKNKRKVWEIETFAKAIDVVNDDLLELCMHLTFACSLRIGEILGLTCDNIIIEKDSTRLVVEKQLSRVSKQVVVQLREKSIVRIFPSAKDCTTNVVLMTPKTESSNRTV